MLIKSQQNTADVLIFINNNLIKPNTIISEYTLPLFTESWRKKINGLLKKGVFKFINIADILEEVRIFNSQFINKIKNAGTDKTFKKFRLVI